MASLSHTAPSRPLVCNKPHLESTASLDGPPRSRGIEQERKLYTRTALAVVVIEGLIKTQHDYQQALHAGESRCRTPLNAAQRIGLETVIGLLHHDVDTLSPETRG